MNWAKVVDEVRRIITKTAIFFSPRYEVVWEQEFALSNYSPHSTGYRDFVIKSLCTCRVPKLEGTLGII